MKRKIFLGALVMSAALVSQAMAGDLLDRLAGLKCGECGEVACCKPAGKCCPEPACCEKACPKACEKACAKPACCAKCGGCGESCCCKRCDLFAGLKDLFRCHQCGG